MPLPGNLIGSLRNQEASIKSLDCSLHLQDASDLHLYASHFKTKKRKKISIKYMVLDIYIRTNNMPKYPKKLSVLQCHKLTFTK